MRLSLVVPGLLAVLPPLAATTRVGFAGCDARTTTTTSTTTTTTPPVPCAQASFPQCGGTCAGGLVCGGFESYDPQTNRFTRFCGCADSASSCGFDSSGTCQA